MHCEAKGHALQGGERTCTAGERGERTCTAGERTCTAGERTCTAGNRRKDMHCRGTWERSTGERAKGHAEAKGHALQGHVGAQHETGRSDLTAMDDTV
jgi:hypothetical protein